jgi:tetratricopeptide (TPR) repeat protein
MIRSTILAALLALASAVGLLFAQTANPKQPKVKSQKEAAAIQAMFSAQTPDARIAAALDLVTNFADTDFKATAFYIAAFSAQQKGDTDNVIVYSEKALEADPQNFGAMIMIADILAMKTREFDLDKEEKLGRAEKLAKQAIELIKVAPKPNPQVADEQWEAAKKDYTAQCYEALGLAALARKNYEGCAENLQTAATSASQPDPATLVRLGSCLRQLKKYDEAMAVLDKALADQSAAPIVRQAATQEKLAATQAKAAAEKK